MQAQFHADGVAEHVLQTGHTERHDSNPLILGDLIWQVCFASNNRERVILTKPLKKRIQILAMRFDAAHHAGDAA